MSRFAQPDIILFNATIHTLNERLDVVNALAITADRIIAVGTIDEMFSIAAPGTETINLDGMCILPGLTDSHIHILKYAQNIERVNCELPSLDDCIRALQTKLTEKVKGQWIQGHGWNQNVWNRFGTRSDLDEVSEDHPIYLTAKSLHAAWANSTALAIAGIDKHTLNPSGGEIQRDSNGEPTGILFESAMKLVSQHVPANTSEGNADLVAAAQERLWKYGITGVHDFDGPSAFSALQLLHVRQELGLRIIKHIPVNYLSSAIEIGLIPGFGNKWLRVGNIKVFMDGALGPHTAAMFEPYEGQGDNVGMLLLDSNELTEIGKGAIEAGFGLSVHAIGDRANSVALDAFEKLKRNQFDTHHQIRHRIEHLQLLHPQDVKRVSQLGVIASMQPIHAISDMQMADKFWGKRCEYSYAWRSIVDTGATITFGSDAPVEDPNPFWGIHAAVTRQRPNGDPSPDGWIPKEKISLLEAIKAYTRGPAFAVNQLHQLGSLTVGSYADLLVLPTDPYKIHKSELYDLLPLGTMSGGMWRFRDF
ncbi:MAG: amidohydrolase [Anaerolineales bacterium]|nr:amidohydrolase [Anaerolineales bacterium]